MIHFTVCDPIVRRERILHLFVHVWLAVGLALIFQYSKSFAHASEPAGSQIYPLDPLFVKDGSKQPGPENNPQDNTNDLNVAVPRKAWDELRKRIEVLESPAKKPTGPSVDWTGQLQADAVGITQDSEHRRRYGHLQDGVAFRRARIGMLGAYGPTDYRIEADFALAGRPSLLDVYAGVRGVPVLGMVRVGHFFEPFSLERVTANRFVTFMERSLIDEAFAPARNLGIMSRNMYDDGRGSVAVGLFANESDTFGDSVGTPVGIVGTARLTYLPVIEGPNESRLWHIGVGYSFRQAHNGLVQFRARPELRIGAATPNTPFVVDTKVLAADHFQLIGIESLCIQGPFSMQAECTMVPVNLRNGATQFFYGGYVEVACMLTGEHRRYRHDNGTVDRLIPRHDFVGSTRDSIATGPGSIELALRVSYLDLESGPVRGGRVTDATLGVNWFLNPYLRVTANYVHSMPQAGSGGTDGSSDGFGIRLGYDF